MIRSIFPALASSIIRLNPSRCLVFVAVIPSSEYIPTNSQSGRLLIYDELSIYLEKCMKVLENNYIQINTGNLVLDTFISSHKTMADEKGIQFHSDIRIDKDRMPLEDYDLSIIIGNLLDNAMNECK